MAKRPIIHDWEIGDFFGATVIRGWVDGRRITALYRWWSHGRFGISRHSLGSEEVLKVGRMAPTAFDDLDEARS